MGVTINLLPRLRLWGARQHGHPRGIGSVSWWASGGLV